MADGCSISLALLSDWTTTLMLVFGGCCSNALALEQLVTYYPQAGSLITFAQFLCITLRGIPKFVQFTPYPRLRPRQIPIWPYLIQVLLFYFISLLNNAAFAYKIPMSVHIIFRSGGLVISMFMGWLLLGRRYNWTQIASVLLVTAGVVLTTLSASKPKSAKPDTFSETSTSAIENSSENTYTYTSGILILLLALILSGLLGIIQDKTYARYGNRAPAKDSKEYSGKKNDRPETWQESMFYLHFLSMPMFYSVRQDLLDQFQALNNGPVMHLVLPSSFQSKTFTDAYHSIPAIPIPTSYLILLLNTVTQLVCVSGVHRLTSRVSSLTVTLVLVIRKAVSLVISVMLFGTGMEGARKIMMWTGAGLVLVGTLGYSVAGSKNRDREKKKVN